MADCSDAKRRKILKPQKSGDGDRLLMATSRVTKENDIVEGTLLPLLAKENLDSFLESYPKDSLAMGLLPTDGDLVLKWGTCCSGSEGAFFVMTAVQKALEDCGIIIQFEHAFSCESNKEKRRWIHEVLACGNIFQHGAGSATDRGVDACIFGDIQHMKGAEATCHVHKKLCNIPSVDILVLGTSCKDLSRANGHADKSRPVLAEVSSRGGSAQTFHGFVGYCEAHKPAIIIYENVDSVEDSLSSCAETNLSILMATMKGLGYEGQKIMTDSLQFGLPCRRRRLYILFLDTGSHRLVSMKIQEAFRKVRALVPLCMRSPPCATKCLLQDNNPEHRELIVRKLTELQSQALKRSEKKQPPNTWVDRHMAHADNLGVRWAAPVPQALLSNDWYKCLTKREADALRLSMVEDPHSGFRNLSQSVGRINAASLQPSGQHVGPTMLPGQIMWLQSERRIMLGEEALIFQGFPILPMLRMRTLDPQLLSHSFLQDLAGNAMALPVLMAVLQAGLAAIVWEVEGQSAEEHSDSDELLDDSDLEVAMAAVASLRPQA